MTASMHETDTYEDRYDERDVEVTEIHDVEVRRNAVLFAVVAGLALLVGLAYLVRAISAGGTFGWLAGPVLLAIGGAHLWAFRDARTPLLVADTFGIRMRLGREWHGLPWQEIEQVVVEPRTSVLHDGRLMVIPADAEQIGSDVDVNGRRQLAVTERLYGAPLAVPLGMTTTTSVHHVADALAALAVGKTPVVEMAGWAKDPVQPLDHEHLERWEERQREVAQSSGQSSSQSSGLGFSGAGGVGGQLVESRYERHARAFEGLSIFEDLAGSVLGGVRRGATLISRLGEGRAHDVDVTVSPVTPALTSLAGGRTHILDLPTDQPVVLGAAAPKLDPIETDDESLPEDAELRRPDGLDDWSDDADWDPQPQADPKPEPVIGPRLREAREQLDVGLDELSELTAIRPHVLQAIEAEDFGPCGGDFYARGHLRALARALDLPADELIAEYDDRYADAPVEARQVLEAELAQRGESAQSILPNGRLAIVLTVALTAVLLWALLRLV